MTLNNQNDGNGTGEQPKAKRKPHLKPETGTSWFAVQSADNLYGPCSLEITIETVGILGQDGQADYVRSFCEGFGDFAEICSVKGYGVGSSEWSVDLDLASDNQGGTPELVNKFSEVLTPYLQSSPLLQRQHGFGKAHCRLIDGGSTVFSRQLN